ncbi:hypothetical protein CYMTET_8450 [Cymbomonas tetramitiformis]|uniref:Obg domain-containing protein n=1 Tax=Cymbomonas tetramitiformis TaxID=36881 RepID=A0AAE0GTH6_9CHLO|nr:hypothetical protein CYMTET_8450 [Cymbomonas tetramitiformis]
MIPYHQPSHVVSNEGDANPNGGFPWGSRFVDELFVQVRGGKGGNGCESFWRSNHKKSFGADGGHGGKGGDVIFEACSSLRCLGGLQQVIHATNGSNGQSKAANGKNGKQRVVDVPQGTLIWRLPDITPPPRKRPPTKEEGDAKKKRKPLLVAASHPPPVYPVTLHPIRAIRPIPATYLQARLRGVATEPFSALASLARPLCSCFILLLAGLTIPSTSSRHQLRAPV